MDRQTALDKLELIRPDANDFQHPDFAEALAFLETDEEAREIFAQRQSLDRGISRAMQSVVVPEGLRGRLKAALESERPHTAQAAPAIAPPRNSRRRWMLSACAVLAGGLLAAIGVWFWGERPLALLSLAELANQAPFEKEEVAKLSAFDGHFEPEKPSHLWTSDRLFAFSSPAKGMAPNRAGSDRVAVYEFFFHDPKPRHPGTLRGVMLVAPRSEIADPPESQGFLDGNYATHSSKPGIAIRSWSEGDLVYVCLVPIEHFEALADVFDAPWG